jgi:hypothetical protein
VSASRFLLALLALLLWPSAASARPVRVRGGARVQAQAQFVGDDKDVLELRGRLIDDARAPIEGAWIDLVSKTGLSMSNTFGCSSPLVTIAPLATPPGESGLRVKTALGGEICLRWRDAPSSGSLALRFGGDTYHAGAELETAFDRRQAQRLATTLRFEPRPLLLDLDKERIAISGRLELALNTAHAARGGNVVTLHDERDKEIARGETAGDGKIRLTIPVGALGPPGVGALVLRFAGNEALGEAKDEQPITRRATVTLALIEPIAATDPGDAATAMIALSTSRGAADGGVLEALVDGIPNGSAQVKDGSAELSIPLDPKAKGSVSAQIRYLPSSPFYQPGAPLLVEISVAPPSVALRVLLMVLVSAAAAWVVISWRRSKQLPTLGKGRPLLTPGVHVVHSRRGTKSWNGTVVDAHDGHALEGVRVVVLAPDLEGDGVLRECVSDAYGKFAFDLEQRPDGAEIVASSSTHSEERKGLPAGGTLRIALITRRRALLRRLVQWARIRGAPYDAKPDPTPGQVRGSALSTGKPEVEAWARRVEDAAFGPGEVDAATEARVREVEPGP